MSIQIGTVDGLINITEDKINCFINAIDAFSSNAITKARELGISLGTAFQRFVEPVYKNNAERFELNSLQHPVLTRSGKEQSPARVTFCRKMGLLDIDDSADRFTLTPIGEALKSGHITINEYAFIVLSKQGIFKDGIYKENLLSLIADWFTNHYYISENSLKDYIQDRYDDFDIIKTRFDIILNALSCCELLVPTEKGLYVLADIKAAAILEFISINRQNIRDAILDEANNYTDYIGSLSFGIFDILGFDKKHLLNDKYPHLRSVVTTSSSCFASKLDIEKYRKDFNNYLFAMRTKPFLLLAGISGTGKSRIVKQMAFDSCPDNAELRSDPTSPGNYCLIEVKPNWHDSTELLGYESKIGGAHYQLTTFVKFLAKAMLHPKVPFFVCLDEMNLAPVEQYFAEFLSVLESRTKLEDGHIVSEPLIKASVFTNSEYENDLKHELFDVKIKEKDTNGVKIFEAELNDDEKHVYEQLREYGLRIPENVVVIGTVNMDETTHQFSRKVIDRAMAIEMNLPEGDPFMDFFANASNLEYRVNPTSPSLYLATETKASDVVNALAADNAEKTEWLKTEVAKVLTGINSALDGTPFKVAYRVQNELMLYFYQLWLEDKTAEWENILNASVDQILMMKVLPRIEGDEELLGKPLDHLIVFSESYPNANKKLVEMKSRLEQSRFTSFWP